MHWRPAVPSVAGLIPARRVAFGALVALAVATGGSVASAQESGDAPGAPGGGSSWTTGDKIALGTASGTASPVWFTVANGVMTEVFYPRADVPNVQDLQYVISDGATFVELERDATTHAVSMPDERPLLAVFVTEYSSARSSGIDTACVVASRSSSTKVAPSLITYCRSCTLGTSARG